MNFFTSITKHGPNDRRMTGSLELCEPEKRPANCRMRDMHGLWTNTIVTENAQLQSKRPEILARRKCHLHEKST